VAAANLLALLDDIATLMDDIAVMSKVAAKKTAGVLGDDLALNADQVQGVKADRELPVVWAVAKGSLLNKVILVPAALIISHFVPSLITLLLILGGLFLCFEGAEKLLHKYLPHDDERAQQEARIEAVSKPDTDMVAFEKDKIKGAIRTDFILSAEIIVIALGSVSDAPFTTQLGVLVALSLAITVGVYGLVAAIVKMDDVGLYLLRKSLTGSMSTLQRFAGRALLVAAPALMKTLAVVGTIAMFLVGGGILTHNISLLHHVAADFIALAPDAALVMSILADGIAGLAAGAVLAVVFTAVSRLRKPKAA
jgi:predicted DNA repair protein MutK